MHFALNLPERYTVVSRSTSPKPEIRNSCFEIVSQIITKLIHSRGVGAMVARVSPTKIEVAKTRLRFVIRASILILD